MNWKVIIFLLLAYTSVSLAQSRDRNKNPHRVVCYVNSFANYRYGDGNFLIEHIDPSLCTHLIYGFAKLKDNKIASYDPFLDLRENWGKGAYHRFNNLKKANAQLSTLIAIGGQTEGSTKYSKMAADPAARKVFVQSVIDFCNKYDFDGLSLDWEYPADKGGDPADKQNFVLLLKELKEAFEPQGLILTAAVSANQKIMDTAYSIAEISDYLDFIIVMAFDFHGPWEKEVMPHAPLYEYFREDEDKHLAVDSSIWSWVQNGTPRGKIVLGIATYGRSFTLVDFSATDLKAPALGAGRSGPFTKHPGFLGYNEICFNFKHNWTVEFLDEVFAPYAYMGSQWVGYDNQKSVNMKLDFLMRSDLAGVMVFSLDTDDFRGKCGDGRYPLLRTIAERLIESVAKPSPKPRTTLQPSHTTSDPYQEFKCSGEGYFRDPRHCHQFYYCVKDGNRFVRHEYTCGEDAAFDEAAKTCVSDLTVC